MNAFIHFGDLRMLHLLWAVPAVGVFLYLAGRRARRALGRLTRVKGLAVLDPSRRKLRAVLYLAVLALLVVALMRPGWNPQPVTVHQEGRDVVFVVDVSRSMLAQDLAPNRLERAKLAIMDTLPVLSGDRVGVVAFAGSATVVCPLTWDYGFFRWAVEGLSPASTPEGGTLIGDAVRKVSEDVFDPQELRYKDVILITDGEDQDSFPVEAAAQAGEQGMRIIAIGLGDEVTGSRIPVGDSPVDQAYLTDQGREVWTRLQPEILRRVARATPGGRYLHAATGVFDLGDIYRDLIRNESGRDLGEMEITRYQEKFQIFLAAVFVLLVLEMLIGEVSKPLFAWNHPLLAVRNLTRMVKRPGVAAGLRKLLRDPATRKNGPAPRLLPLVPGVLLAALALGAPGAGGAARAAGAVPGQVEEGNRAYQEGSYHDAASRYEKARQEDPGSPVPLFNMGVALYRQENYPAALTAFQSPQLTALRAPSTAALVHYNQGNSLARMGQAVEPRSPGEALRLYERSVQAYKRALDLEPGHRDAAYNIEVVRHWIEELRAGTGEQSTGGDSAGEPSPRREQQPEGRSPSPPGGEDPAGPQDDGPQAPREPEAPQAPAVPRDEPGILRDETAQSILEEEQRRREADAREQGGARAHGRPTW